MHKENAMDILFEIIESYDVYIIIGLSLLSIIMLIMLIINNTSINRLSRKYRKFMRGSKDKNIEELLMSLIDRTDSAIEKVEGIKSMYGDMDKRVKNCIQKTSIVRYKAFDDMGSALSFSIALLDDYDGGVIVTGIYGRNETTTYAKPIDKGIPKYDLSDEEKHVLQDAMKKK
jgi:hypothetical protein